MNVIKYGANIFLGACIVFVTLLIGTLIHDYQIDPPFLSMSSTADPTAPGDVSRIEFTYSRTHTPAVKVGERILVCEDGTKWILQSIRDIVSVAWPSGINVKADLKIKIPEKVASGQTCYYSATITYPRIILPDLILKNPAVSTEIKIL